MADPILIAAIACLLVPSPLAAFSHWKAMRTLVREHMAETQWLQCKIRGLENELELEQKILSSRSSPLLSRY